jgi:hypothetical protein
MGVGGRAGGAVTWCLRADPIAVAGWCAPSLPQGRALAAVLQAVIEAQLPWQGRLSAVAAGQALAEVRACMRCLVAALPLGWLGGRLDTCMSHAVPFGQTTSAADDVGQPGQGPCCRRALGRGACTCMGMLYRVPCMHAHAPHCIACAQRFRAVGVPAAACGEVLGPLAGGLLQMALDLKIQQVGTAAAAAAARGGRGAWAGGLGRRAAVHAPLPCGMQLHIMSAAIKDDVWQAAARYRHRHDDGQA